MRISKRTDYAVRAAIELAARPDGWIKADEIARAQGIPLRFLLAILNDLRVANVVRSQRGNVGGYALKRPAHEITVADVMRAMDGPLATVHGASLSELEYAGSAANLLEVWMAVRTSLRQVLEQVSLQDLVAGELPSSVMAMAAEYRQSQNDRGASL